MSKVNKLLVVLLLLQAGITFWVYSADAPLAPPIAARIVEDMKAKDATALELYDDNAKLVVSAQKKDDAWLLDSHFDYPASSKLSELLARIGALESLGIVTTDANRHTQLGVGKDNYERKLVLKSDKGEVVIYLGQELDNRRRAVRIGDNPAVYGAKGMPSQITTTVADWCQTAYVSVDPRGVQRFAVNRPAVVISVSRNKGDWDILDPAGTKVPTPTGKLINNEAITAALRSATFVSLVEPVAPTLATVELASYTLTPVDIDITDSAKSSASILTSPITVRVFEEDQQYVLVQRNDSPHVVRVSKAAMSSVLTLSPESLFTDIPTAAPAAAGAPALP